MSTNSPSRSLVSIRTVPYSALVEGLRRFGDWSQYQVPLSAIWEIFGWSEEVDLPGILNLLDVEVVNGLVDGMKLLTGVAVGSTLVSQKNKRSFRSRLPGVYQLCTFPKLDVSVSLTEKQAAYAYCCPVHDSKVQLCTPLRFYEVYFLYLLWYHSHIFDLVRLGKMRSASIGEKLQLDLRNLIVSKVLPFFKSDISRLLDAVNSSTSYLAIWLTSPAVHSGASLGRLVGAASPCTSKYYCSRIEVAFTPENSQKLARLAADVLSPEDLSVLDVAAKGLPLSKIPRASSLAKEVCKSRVPFLKMNRKNRFENRIDEPENTKAESPRRWEQGIKMNLPEKATIKLAVDEISECSPVFGEPKKKHNKGAVSGEDYGLHWRRMLKIKADLGSPIKYEPIHGVRNWFISSNSHNV